MEQGHKADYAKTAPTSARSGGATLSKQQYSPSAASKAKHHSSTATLSTKAPTDSVPSLPSASTSTLGKSGVPPKRGPLSVDSVWKDILQEIRPHVPKASDHSMSQHALTVLDVAPPRDYFGGGDPADGPERLPQTARSFIRDGGDSGRGRNLTGRARPGRKLI